MPEFTIDADGVGIAGEEAGESRPVVLLHGLTATRRYVVMGSRSLERAGHRVVTYDARGHGTSEPAPDPAAYGYDVLVADLIALLEDRGIARAIFAGASMGAHTLMAFTLAHPERVAGLCVITPAFDPDEQDESAHLARWDALSDGLRTGGVDGFLEAYGEPAVPERWRDTVKTVLRQRLALHAHPDAVADALHAVPRSRPFKVWSELGAIDVPTVVVADRDDADPGHPLAVGEAYAAAIPGARLMVEEPGSSPLAWQGSQLSRIIASLADQAA